ASGNVAAALVKGYGLSHGAIGLTIAHDSHNMIIIGTNDDDMLAAAEELSEIQGGVVITDGGDVKAELALPVAGLMSPHSAEEVASDIRQINRIAHEMGVSYAYDPIFSLTFLSLVVMPELKLSDKGLIDFSLSVIPVNAE
ncbi:MAG: adenine deaminase C-terminal domain-containing protein, partial [Veillonellaceae bacterium]|nr:adenine deaminase C-terminal domain-containing protein [Veillonellaceae bacterium]